MKKTEKLDCLRQAVGTYDLCRCSTVFDDSYYLYYYVLDYSDTLMLGVEEDDFQLDGFEVCKISQLKEIVLRDDLCTSFNKERRILDGVVKPEVCLDSWKTVMESLQRRSGFLIVENEDVDEGFFYIGKIREVRKSSVLLSWFDADGVWYEATDIPFRRITRVIFDSRYAKRWEEYFAGKNGSDGGTSCTTN